MINKQLITDWVKLQHDLKVIKEKEMLLRKKIVQEMLLNTSENTITTSLYNYELKAVRKLNYTLNKNSFEDKAALGLLTPQELLAVNLVPTLIQSKYNKLPDNCLLKQELVIIKPASPTLKIESSLS